MVGRAPVSVSANMPLIAPMAAPELIVLFVLGLACVPIAWLLPRRLAFDGVAAWTLACLLAVSPATALWLLSTAVLVPVVTGRITGARGLATMLACGAVITAFVAARLSPGWGWIGGAYFTLRALHVILDWWMGRGPAPSLRDSLRYFLFLPVLPAGPVNRLPLFQHQIRRRRWEPAMILSGAERILLGLVFIYLVSNKALAQLDLGLARLLSDMAAFWQVWAGSALGWVELFFVFAGATHLALGTALMMGLTLEENFNAPWRARDLAEFWTRWHMSLTAWVRDYVFRPVTALTRQPVVAVMAAMLVIGLWHAFSLYYVLWSVWQALGIVLSRLLSGYTGPARLPRRAAAVLGPLGVLAWLSAARPVIGTLLGDLP